jgi:hypothetical protein
VTPDVWVWWVKGLGGAVSAVAALAQNGPPPSADQVAALQTLHRDLGLVLQIIKESKRNDLEA